MPKQYIHVSLEDQGFVDSEFENIYKTVPELKTGTSAPADMPAKVGDEYINETTDYFYKAIDNQVSADWKHVVVEDASASLTQVIVGSGVSAAGVSAGSGSFSDSFLANALIFLTNLPTASAGLATGQVWNDSGALKIIV